MSALNKVGRELVIELLNRDNFTNLTFDDINFGSPEALVVTADIRNTKLEVSAVDGGRFRGRDVVTYWRLALDEVLVGTNREITAEGVTNTLELLDIINQRYDLMITHEDVVVEEIDTTTLPMKYLLRTIPGSYGYIKDVELDLVDSKTELSEVITITLLEQAFYPGLSDLTIGNPTFTDANGDLLSAPTFSPGGVSVISNDELEVYLGIHTMDSSVTHTPLAGVYTVDLATGLSWFLDVGVGLTDTTRVTDILDEYKVELSLAYEFGGTIHMELVKDSEQDVGWAINGSSASFDAIYEFDGKIVADSINTSWMRDIIKHANVTENGSLLDQWNVKLSIKPLSSASVKPIDLNVVLIITDSTIV